MRHLTSPSLLENRPLGGFLFYTSDFDTRTLDSHEDLSCIHYTIILMANISETEKSRMSGEFSDVCCGQESGRSHTGLVASEGGMLEYGLSDR